MKIIDHDSSTHNTNNILQVAARVLREEGAAITQMAESVPKDFAAVVQLILKTNGRIVFSGIGKSGHIARKIASTLASTGTPAYFVHPAEASHGDLGMITPQDVCVLISNSGETAELGDIISHTKRFSIPMVAMSRCKDSTLMRAADYRLQLPNAAEACSIGMVPTTSTTLTLALGDALAVALMEQRAFMSEQFRTLHPGGKLGAQMAQVNQLMHQHSEVPLVSMGTPMSETLILMTEKGFGIACVVDKTGALCGVVTDGDLRRNIQGLMECDAGTVATMNPKTVSPTMLAVEAVRIMNQVKVNVLVVVDDSQHPIGLLRLHDCLRAGVV